MFRTSSRALVALVAAGLIGAALVAPAGATARSQTQGITDDEITIVALVSDLDGLRARGFNLAPKLTTGNLIKRWQGYADAYGPVNGRKVVIKPAVWDPLDATTFDAACTRATQDTKPFVVVNGAGFRQSSVGCITIDNDTPLFWGDSAYADLQKASGKNLVGLGLPPDVTAKTTTSLATKAKLIPKGAKIGVLSANEPGIKATGDALEAELTKSKYDVVSKVEVNTLSADSATQNRESTAAVATMQAAGVDTVLILLPFTSATGYYQELKRTNAGFANFIVETGANCTQFTASRIPAEAEGVPCITPWDTRALPTEDGVKKDSAFEAKCRAQFDAALGEKTQPGVPAGDLTVNGVVYTEDFGPAECTILNVLLPAIEKAGKNPTWDKVYANLMKTTDAPAAYESNGTGGFAKKKPYFANQVHVQAMNAAGASTPKDANGVTFNGCPVPANCWIPQLVDGQEWFPIVTK